MFAAAFPLGAVLSLAFLYLEFMSDLFKLIYLRKRPLSVKTYNIGTWEKCVKFMAYLSIFSNLLLFSFGSDQILSFFPKFFNPSFDKTKPIIGPSPNIDS
jgi:hypothetical protein